MPLWKNENLNSRGSEVPQHKQGLQNNQFVQLLCIRCWSIGKFRMLDYRKININSEWIKPCKPRDFDVENPATESAVAVISLGAAEDVDSAVTAAKTAFPAYAATSVAERLALLEKLYEIYIERYDEMSEAISLEMGAPIQGSAGTGTA